jgi:hypothetical protein
MFTGKVNVMDLPVTQEQIDKYNAGALVQNAFPNLNAEQREFLQTGTTPEEWKQFLPEEETDDED